MSQRHTGNPRKGWDWTLDLLTPHPGIKASTQTWEDVSLTSFFVVTIAKLQKDQDHILTNKTTQKIPVSYQHLCQEKL